MNNSVLMSGGVTITATQVAPAVQWALSGFHGVAPESVTSLIAMLVIMVIHMASVWITSPKNPPEVKP